MFCSLTAVVIGFLDFWPARSLLRHRYTWRVAIAAGELVSNWDWIGGGQGIALPVYPGDLDHGKIFFYFLFAAITGVLDCSCFVAGFTSTRFGAAINAIRDDEEKADAMGIHTLRYKLVHLGHGGFLSSVSPVAFRPSS